MTDGIANHAIDLGVAIELVSAIEVLHFVERDLARSGGVGDWRVGQNAAFPQGEDAGGQADLAHG